MRKLINNLREKPEEHKKAVALGSAFVITLIILGVWITTLPYRLQSIGIADETKKQLQDGITPLATVKASIDSIVGDVKNVKDSFQNGTSGN